MALFRFKAGNYTYEESVFRSFNTNRILFNSLFLSLYLLHDSQTTHPRIFCLYMTYLWFLYEIAKKKILMNLHSHEWYIYDRTKLRDRSHLCELRLHIQQVISESCRTAFFSISLHKNDWRQKPKVISSNSSAQCIY